MIVIIMISSVNRNSLLEIHPYNIDRLIISSCVCVCLCIVCVHVRVCVFVCVCLCTICPSISKHVIFYVHMHSTAHNSGEGKLQKMLQRKAL